MAVMPYVPKTKMADIGKLIRLGSLLARKTMWFVLTSTSTTSILSHIFGAYYMTRLVYKYTHLPTPPSFTFSLAESTYSFHCDFQREHSHSLHLLIESTHSSSFLHLTSSSQPPRKCILHATILFLVILFRWDFFQPRTPKFHQTTERNSRNT